jgi:hypothetical protein
MKEGLLRAVEIIKKEIEFARQFDGKVALVMIQVKMLIEKEIEKMEKGE